MSKQYPEQGSLFLTSSVQASPAKISRKPTPTATGSTESGPACSGGCSTALTHSSPPWWSSRTPLDWFGGAWTSSCPSCAAVDTRWSGRDSALKTSELRTGASGSLSWPTPSAGAFNDGESPESWQSRNERLRAKGYNGNGMGMPLGVAVRWPTPTAGDSKSSGSSTPSHVTLCDATERAWASPAATDHKGSRTEEQRRGQLTAQTDPDKPGRLNPDWVESLMGFPPGWTVPVGPPLAAPISTSGRRPVSALDSPETKDD